FYIGGFGITNSMLYTLVVIFGLVLFFWLATRKMSLVPKGAQNFAEVIVEFLLGLVEGTAGKRVGRRIFPLIATLFIFILFANWSALIPGVGTIGVCRAEQPSSGGQGMVVRTALPSLQEQPKGGLPTPADRGY